MRISIIVAIAENNAIGLNNKLIYWLPNDLKRFKQLTTGNTIIMGRKTFESLPKGALPNRRNIVLTRNAEADGFQGAECFRSLEDALKTCAEGSEVYIIGGAYVYNQAIEQQFIDILGTKVTLKGDLKRGMIQIEYFSRDDLDRLYEILTK